MVRGWCFDLIKHRFVNLSFRLCQRKTGKKEQKREHTPTIYFPFTTRVGILWNVRFVYFARANALFAANRGGEILTPVTLKKANINDISGVKKITRRKTTSPEFIKAIVSRRVTGQCVWSCGS